MQLLKDKVAIVTGGSRGIGEAIVRKFAESGATIAFSYISDSSKERAEKIWYLLMFQMWYEKWMK